MTVTLVYVLVLAILFLAKKAIVGQQTVIK